VLRAANAIAAQVVSTRRRIHRQPELGFQVQGTAGLVAERLGELGLQVRTEVGGSGVVGLLEGGGSGGTVLLRADMDALPIQEASGVSFASERPGIMHACGHDAHTAMLLGVAELLTERRRMFDGRVVFMFQPAEEVGGVDSGAVRMIAAGVLDDPPVDAAFALHVDAAFSGQIALMPGPAMASTDSFTITVRGSGGHAARPQRTVDPIVVGAQIVGALQTLVSREVAPEQPAVVTVGKFTSGSAANVIPDTAELRGTIRCYRPSVREMLLRRVAELSAGIASAMRASAECVIKPGYPVLVNDPAMVSLAADTAAELLGPDVLVPGGRLMGGEDFACVLQRVPGAMLRLGVTDRAWDTPRPKHSARFDLDERALPAGVALVAGTALRWLEAHGSRVPPPATVLRPS